MRNERLRHASGMSLIEVVIAIVIISTALTGILSAICTMMEQSTDPVVEEQGLLFGQSYLLDLLSRDYDAVCTNLLGVTPCTGTCTPASPCTVTYNSTTLPGTPEQYNPILQQMLASRYTITVNITDSGFDIIPSDYGRTITASVQHLRLGSLTITQGVQNVAILNAYQARHKPKGT
ncbi:MAG: prepilin-type N-terminal cleavage/methylation domain-containing protein [Pseudomonadota bacterium]